MLLGLLAGALLFPFFWTQYALTIGTEVLVAALFAIGLNILIGTTGLVSLGSSMFVGLGGYGVGVSEFMTEARRGREAESLPWQYDCHHIPV